MPPARHCTYDEISGPPKIKWNGALDLSDMLFREGDVERFKVCVEVLNLAPADDGEDIRRTLHHVRDSDWVCVRLQEYSW